MATCTPVLMSSRPPGGMLAGWRAYRSRPASVSCAWVGAVAPASRVKRIFKVCPFGLKADGIPEAAHVQLMSQRDSARAATAMLGHDDVRLTCAGVVAVLRVRPVDQEDDVRVLLQGAGLAEVGGLG